MIMKKIVYASLATAMVLAVAIGGKGLAQVAEPGSKTATANTLKVSPLRADISVDPGKTATTKITVTNPSGSDVLVKPIQNDFIAGDESGNAALILDEDEYAPSRSLKRFMQPLDSFTVGANASRTVEVTIAVPADAKPGGYFGAVRFAPTDPDSGGQVNMSPSVASLILLTVNGDTPQKLELTDFVIKQGTDVKQGFLMDGSNVSISARFKNPSNIQLAPFGKVSVKKGQAVVYEADFNNQQPKNMVLPDSARRWDTPLEKIDGLGRYTVSATFTYGASNQTIEVEKSFWLIPLWLVIAAPVAVLVLVALIIVGVIRINNRSKGISLKR